MSLGLYLDYVNEVGVGTPQCYSTSFRWRGALLMLGLEEASP